MGRWNIDVSGDIKLTSKHEIGSNIFQKEFRDDIYMLGLVFLGVMRWITFEAPSFSLRSFSVSKHYFLWYLRLNNTICMKTQAGRSFFFYS